MITQEYLKSLLHYDPDTGIFTWLKKIKSVNIGDVAGCLHNRGYIAIKIDGKKHLSHRLAFFYMTSHFPPEHIDHINGNKSDNRFSNLRPATNQENQRNRGVNSNNKLQVKGVYENKSGTYRAQIKLDKIYYYLGSYYTADEASIVYELYAKEFFGDFYK